MKFSESLVCVFVFVVVDEPEPLRLPILIDGDDGRRDISELVEKILELVLSDVERNVLDVQVRVMRAKLVNLGLPLPPGDVDTDEDDLVVEQHAVDASNRSLCCLSSVIVDKTVSERVALRVGGDFARKNVTECSKSVVKSLVVDILVKVFDEDVSSAGLSEGRVSLGPHNTARSVLDQRIVKLLESAFT